MATLYQRGDVWYLNWRQNGKQWRRSLGAIEARAAEKIRREKDAELTLGIEPASESPTLADWIDDYCDWQEAEHGTVKRKYELKRIRAKLGHLHIATLPARLVEEYKIDRLREAKPETVGKELRILKAAMNRAVALGVITKNPIAGIKPPRGITSKAVQFFTAAQLKKICEADATMAPIWRFMVSTGMRRGEFVKARRADVIGGVIRIESTDEGRTKSGKWREVPLNAGARTALKLLGRDKLCAFAKDTLSHRFARIAKEAGVGGNLHMLRHTFCTHLVIAGVQLRNVQLLAGHSSIAMTEIYSHMAKSNKTQAVDLLKF